MSLTCEIRIGVSPRSAAFMPLQRGESARIQTPRDVPTSKRRERRAPLPLLALLTLLAVFAPLTLTAQLLAPAR